MTSPNGLLIYDGPSLLNRAPIFCVLTGLGTAPSENRKTGPLLQTWILSAESDPIRAWRTGADESVCGDCPHRGSPDRARSCYVNLGQAPDQVYGAEQRNRYPALTSDHFPLLRGRTLRIGSYGDPVAVPLSAWRPVLRVVDDRIGYTHQWHRKRFQPWRPYLMASCDSPADRRAALALGWRTFRVRLPDEPLLPGEFACPASKEAGHRLTCSECLACDGAHRSLRSASPSLVLHGDGLPNSSPKLDAFRSYRAGADGRIPLN